MDQLDAEKLEPEKEQKKDSAGRSEDSLFGIEEIRIEELAVDGICGVY